MAAITTKELSGLEDQLSLEKNMVAKYQNFADTTQDTALQNKYEEIAQRHQKHFDALFSQLK